MSMPPFPHPVVDAATPSRDAMPAELEAMEQAAELRLYSQGRLWDEDLCLLEIRHAHANIIDQAVTIGRNLLWAKHSLAHGRFEAWCQANIGYSDMTCRNYMRLAEVAVRRPALLPMLREAGMKKALLLTALPESDQDLLAQNQLPQVDAARLGEMSYGELREELARAQSQVKALSRGLAESNSSLEAIRRAEAKARLESQQLQRRLNEQAGLGLAPPDVEGELDQVWDAVAPSLDNAYLRLRAVALRWDELSPRQRAALSAQIDAVENLAHSLAVLLREATGEPMPGHVYRRILEQAEATESVCPMPARVRLHLPQADVGE